LTYIKRRKPESNKDDIYKINAVRPVAAATAIPINIV
jgi:hypothetical protein